MQIKWYINEQYVHQPVLYHRIKDHVSKFYEGPNRRWGLVSQLCEAGFWVAVCSAAVPPLRSASAIHKPSRKTLALTYSLSPERGLFQWGISVIFQTPPMSPGKHCLLSTSWVRCHAPDVHLNISWGITSSTYSLIFEQINSACTKKWETSGVTKNLCKKGFVISIYD